MRVWPVACNSASKGGRFEGMWLLLGVAYVQPHEINRASFTPVLWRGEEAFTMLL